MKKHIRHKKAIPKNTVCIHYISPSTNVCYALERMSLIDFVQLSKYLSKIYGIKYDPARDFGDLIAQALTDIPECLPEDIKDKEEFSSEVDDEHEQIDVLIDHFNNLEHKGDTDK